jgi:hypothetical protein
MLGGRFTDGKSGLTGGKGAVTDGKSGLTGGKPPSLTLMQKQIY